MKTIQIVGNSPVGGGTYLIIEWCKYLRKQGCQVDVLTTDKDTQSLLSNIPGVNIISEFLIPRDISPLEDLSVLIQLIRFFRQQQYDVVHTYTATAGLLGRIGARLAGTPAIFHHQASWTVTEFTSLPRRLLFTPLEYVSTLASTKGICVSHATKELARRYHTAPQSKLVTICNGIDTEPFISQDNGDRPIRRELGIGDETILIGNTGRFSPDKDNRSLIHSLSLLDKLAPEHRFALVFAGIGPMLEDARRLAHEVGVADRVHFLGYREDIPDFLASIDVFVTPSLREGLSISVMEAMAAAKPIIATSILPNQELIKHEETGLLVEPKNPNQIAHAVSRFVNEPELARRCACMARESVSQNYTINQMLQSTWELYVESLMARTRTK